MKQRISTLLISLLVTVLSMAQGWPENYGGVMLQGFYWDSFADTQWTRLEKQADQLATTFNLVWVPQSAKAKASPSNGYDPLYWFDNYNSSYGNGDELKQMISTLKGKGIGTIADVVINHRETATTWNDFVAETYNGVEYALTYEDICSNDEAAKQGYEVGPNKDTGEGWDGMRDLDHQSERVQSAVKAYLKMLLNDYGYTGFRYDMVKGYAGSYTKLYNEDSKPQFSVGECWDSSNTIRKWIDATSKTSAAFDFQFRYTVRNAINNGDWSKLAAQNEGNWPLVSSSFNNGSYRQYAVTFVENHDTEYRSASNQQDPIRKDTLAANAYLLAMPGTPCVFLKHWKSYKQEIANMVAVRKAVGITNTSRPIPMATNKDYYAVQVVGSGDKKLLCVVGSKADSYTPTSDVWKKVISGYHYVYYVSGIEPNAITLPELKEDEEQQEGEFSGVPSFCSVGEGEICAFFEAPVTWGSQIYTWAWMNGGDGKNYVGTSWPGVAATLIGTANNGNKVFKWISAKTTAPDNIIFSGGGNQTADLKFVKGGYYNQDGLKANVSTGIRAITPDNGDAAAYSLDGRRMKHLKPGIYIRNNKKLIIR